MSNDEREPTQSSLGGGFDMTKRWIPRDLSDQIYQCLRDIYPYERKLIGMHPVKVIEMPGLYVIQLYSNNGYMMDLLINIHLLTAQYMTREHLISEFFRLIQKALNIQDRMRNKERLRDGERLRWDLGST